MREPGARPALEIVRREIAGPEDRFFDAFARLVAEVFASAPVPAWRVLASFDHGGRCVAGLQHAILDLRLDGTALRCAAVRNVAVAADRRGRGLMTDLFARLLPWCDTRADVGLLYAETPALYAPFGFAPLAQHGFEAAAPLPAGPPTARRIEGASEGDLLARLVRERAPLSDRVFMAGDRGLTLHALQHGGRPLFYDPTLDAAFAVENDGDVLVLDDVVAPAMPTAARILGALGTRPARLRTLFPPDRLGWTGDPVSEDAGLMIRGPVPEALRRPFTLPPTVEF